jgi:hypothetical protein
MRASVTLFDGAKAGVPGLLNATSLQDPHRLSYSRSLLNASEAPGGRSCRRGSKLALGRYSASGTQWYAVALVVRSRPPRRYLQYTCATGIRRASALATPLTRRVTVLTEPGSSPLHLTEVGPPRRRRPRPPRRLWAWSLPGAGLR